MTRYCVQCKAYATIVIDADSEEEAQELFYAPDNFKYACEEINEAEIEIDEIYEEDE